MSDTVSVPKQLHDILWQSLCERSNDGIFAIDEEQKIIFANLIYGNHLNNEFKDNLKYNLE